MTISKVQNNKKIPVNYCKKTIAGNVHEMPFTSDAQCLDFLKTRYIDFIASVLSSDAITVVKPDSYILAYINTATGEQTVKHWNG